MTFSGWIVHAHPVPNQGGLMDRFPESSHLFKAACTPKILDRHWFSKTT